MLLLGDTGYSDYQRISEDLEEAIGLVDLQLAKALQRNPLARMVQIKVPAFFFACGAQEGPFLLCSNLSLDFAELPCV